MTRAPLKGDMASWRVMSPGGSAPALETITIPTLLGSWAPQHITPNAVVHKETKQDLAVGSVARGVGGIPSPSGRIRPSTQHSSDGGKPGEGWGGLRALRTY